MWPESGRCYKESMNQAHHLLVGEKLCSFIGNVALNYYLRQRGRSGRRIRTALSRWDGCPQSGRPIPSCTTWGVECQDTPKQPYKGHSRNSAFLVLWPGSLLTFTDQWSGSVYGSFLYSSDALRDYLIIPCFSPPWDQKGSVQSH